jgi:hypothetical protein
MPKQDGDVPIIACQDGRMWMVTTGAERYGGAELGTGMVVFRVMFAIMSAFQDTA